MSDVEDMRKRINDWLDEYPARRGAVVIFDDSDMSFTDLANLSGLHAAEFATKYRDYVLKNVGLDDFMYEEVK